MDELFKGDKDESSILSDNNVSDSVYSTWIEDNEWQVEFQARIEKHQRNAKILIANYQATAAATLIQLTQDEKSNIARLACIDIINICKEMSEEKEKPTKIEISKEAENKILKIFANEKNKNK